METASKLNYGTNEQGEIITAAQSKENAMKTQAELTYGVDSETGKAVTAAQAEIARMTKAQQLGEITADDNFKRQMGYSEVDKAGNPVMETVTDAEGNTTTQQVRVEGFIEKQTNAQIDYLKAQRTEGNLSAQSEYSRTWGNGTGKNAGKWQDENGNWNDSIMTQQADMQLKVLTATNNANMQRMFGEDVIKDGKLNPEYNFDSNKGEVALQYYYTNLLQVSKLTATSTNAKKEAILDFQNKLADKGIQWALDKFGKTPDKETEAEKTAREAKEAKEKLQNREAEENYGN